MNDPQVRQLRDFMEVYNKIAETCFNHCVTSFANRETSKEEAICTESCVNKYIGLNHQLMQVYIDVQPAIMQRRMEEMSKLQDSISHETNDDVTSIS